MTYQIVTVCTGNICRSPMAEYALRQALEREGLDDRVQVVSVGTSGWEIGNPVDSRAGALLARNGIDAARHRARQMSASELEEADLILTLDHDHVGPVQRLLGGEAGEKVHMLRSFDPAQPSDTGIRDPWYGDESDFDLAWDQITAATEGIIDHVRQDLEESRA